METFIFKFGQEEFITQAASSLMATFAANSFIAKHRDLSEPFGWVSDSEGPNVFRISMGA